MFDYFKVKTSISKEKHAYTGSVENHQTEDLLSVFRQQSHTPPQQGGSEGPQGSQNDVHCLQHKPQIM